MADTNITIKRVEKVIRAADGTMRKLVSYDGVHWRMDAKAERRRVESGIRLEKVKRRKPKPKDPDQPFHWHRDRGWLVPCTCDRPAKPKKHFKKDLEKQFAISNDHHAVEAEPRPVILPVERPLSTFLGKDQGKKQKYRKNLKAKREPEVRFTPTKRPVHYHWCHGKQFSCSCDTPYFRRLCGVDRCLVSQIQKPTKGN